MKALLKDCPGILLQKLFVTLLLGAGCLTVGAIYYIVTLDTVFLVLSIALFVGCLYRSGSLYRMIVSKDYCITEGTLHRHHTQTHAPLSQRAAHGF